MHGSFVPYRGIYPKVAPDVYVAPGSYLIGEVEIAEGSSIWFNCVLRGDVAPIYIGANSNIQDGCTLHGNGYHGIVPVKIGSNVTVGHNVILHACTIGDGAVVGMGAIILTRAVIGEGAVVAAGSVVPEGKVIPPGTLAMGTPAKVVREVKPEDQERFSKTAAAYRERAAEYKAAAETK